MMMWIKQHKSAFISALKIGVLVLAVVFLSSCQPQPANTSDLEAKIQNCWPCTLYKVTFTSINMLVHKLYTSLTPTALAVLSVALLFFLAFRSVRLLTSLIPPNVPRYIREIAIVLFKAIIVSAILLSGNDFLCIVNLIVDPVITTFSLISRSILTSVLPPEEALALVNGAAGFIPPQTQNPDTPQLCMVFSEEMSKNLQLLIYQIYVALNSGVSLGWTLMAEGNIITFPMGLFFVVPSFFMLSLIFPWMFAESFFRMGTVIVLMPFLFVAWVFPATKQMVKPGWDVVFGSMVSILMACIYIALAITVIRIFAENSEYFKFMFGQARQEADPSFSRAMRRLSTEAVSFCALILIILKFHKALPAVAGYFGGDAQKSQIVAFFGGIKQLAISATMIAVGAVMSAFGIPGGTNLMKAGAKRVVEQAKEGAEANFREVTNTGEGASQGSEDAMGGSGAASAFGGVAKDAIKGKAADGDAKGGDAKGDAKGDDAKGGDSKGDDSKGEDKPKGEDKKE